MSHEINLDDTLIHGKMPKLPSYFILDAINVTQTEIFSLSNAMAHN
jgi:hypothetical protein